MIVVAHVSRWLRWEDVWLRWLQYCRTATEHLGMLELTSQQTAVFHQAALGQLSLLP